MELTYVYFNDEIKNIEMGINFNPSFTCIRDENGNIKITKNEAKNNNNYYGEYVRNCNLILGNNGVGKSTLLTIINERIIDRQTKQYEILYHVKDNIFLLKKNGSYFDVKYDFLKNTFEEKEIVEYIGDEVHIPFLTNNIYVTNRNFSRNVNLSFCSINELVMSKQFENISLFKRSNAVLYIIPKIRIDQRPVLSPRHLKKRRLKEVDSSNLIGKFVSLIKEPFVALYNSANKVDDEDDETLLEKENERNKIDFNVFIEKKVEEISNILNNYRNCFYETNDSIPVLSLDLTKNHMDLLSVFDSINDFIYEDSKSIRRNVFLYRYSDFSSGEEQIFNSIMQIISEIDRIKTRIKRGARKNKEILISLDEPDNYLHPEWARKYMKMLIDVLNNYSENSGIKFKFDILVSSHSPFLVSDFFKERISVIKFTDDENSPKREVSTGKFGLMSNIIDVLMNDYYLDMPFGEYSYSKFKDYRKDLNDKILTDKQLKEIENFADNIDDKVFANILKTDIKINRMRSKENDKDK